MNEITWVVCASNFGLLAAAVEENRIALAHNHWTSELSPEFARNAELIAGQDGYTLISLSYGGGSVACTGN